MASKMHYNANKDIAQTTHCKTEAKKMGEISNACFFMKSLKVKLSTDDH